MGRLLASKGICCHQGQKRLCLSFSRPRVETTFSAKKKLDIACGTSAVPGYRVSQWALNRTSDRMAIS